MKNNTVLYIPKPCHEDWQQMMPEGKGRFCQSCAKQVVDFSLMSDQQILNHISKASGGVCGRFAGDQLQRPLQPVKPEKKKVWWAAAILPLVMIFGKAGAQKKKEKRPVADSVIIIEQPAISMGLVSYVERSADGYEYNSEDAESNRVKVKATIIRKKGEEAFIISGIVRDKTGMGIPQAAIAVKGTKTGTFADDRGKFLLKGSTPENHTVLAVGSVGFEPVEVFVSFKDTANDERDKLCTLTGKVTDADNGQAIASASVTGKNKNESVVTDAEGNFSIKINPRHLKEGLIVSSVGYQVTEVPLTLNESPDTVTLGTIKCKPTAVKLSDIVVGGYVAHCAKLSKRDTIPALIQQVFHTEPLRIYPNPAPRGGSINIDLKKAGTYSAQLFDNGGKLLQVKEFDAAEGATQTTFTIPSSVAGGMYYLRVVDNKTGKQYTNKLTVM